MPDSKPTTDPISKSEFAVMASDIKRMIVYSDRIDRLLFGSDPPGLVMRVDRIEIAIKSFENMRAETRRVMYGLVVTILLSFGTFFWGLLTHSIAIVAKVP